MKDEFIFYLEHRLLKFFSGVLTCVGINIGGGGGAFLAALGKNNKVMF